MKRLATVGLVLLFAAPAHAWPWGKYGSRTEAQTACIEWVNAGGRKRPYKPFTPEPFISRSKCDERNAGNRYEWWTGEGDPRDHFYDLAKKDHEEMQRLLAQKEELATALIRSCRLEIDTRQFLGFEKGKKGVVRRFRY